MSILDTILQQTRATVARRKLDTSASDLLRSDGFQRVPVPFAPALRQPDLAFIAESKRRSPSKGLLRDPYDAAANARAYTAAGAAALSILTEPDFFDGSPEHLQAARQVTKLPLLRKDFVVDEYQLLEARAWGADAVLLIAAVHESDLLRHLQQVAAELGLGALIEVHEASEFDRIDWDQAEVVGVNNRNLQTFQVDTSRAPRVFAHLPKQVARVAESGLRDAATLASLRRAGTDAVLIGEAFMRAENPGEALADLRQRVQVLLETPGATPLHS